jgi:uracil-DNA glycosylase
LSAARGFFECKHFVKANEWLRNRYGVEGEVEWDCLAPGKQGKGLTGKEGANKEDKKPAVVVAQETVSKDTKGKTIVESRSLVVGDGFDVTPEDAYDFDDEH